MSLRRDADPGSGNSPSNATSTSLLERVKAQDPDAWQRLVDLYGPLVYDWCRQSALQPEDAADVVQEVFSAVATAIAGFRHDHPVGTFRAWLHTITRNKLHDDFRKRQGRPEATGGSGAQEELLQIAEPTEPSDANPLLQTESTLYRRALELVRAEFEDRTWQAFCRVAVEGRTSTEVAAELGVSVDAVYQAKSRVLRRLRAELGDLEDVP